MEADYREVQKLHPGWRVFIGVSCFFGGAAPLVLQLISGEPVGNKASPMWVLVLIFAAFGVAMPAFMIFCLRLVVEAREDALYVRFIPLRTRRIPYASILRCEPCTYRPIREFGGWGIRWGGQRSWAYTMRGNRGVRLEFEGARRLLIGSQSPEELARAIEDWRTRLP